MPKSYRVTWEIDVDADNPTDAAKLVARMMACPGFTPHDDVFLVRESGESYHDGVEIDLWTLNQSEKNEQPDSAPEERDHD